MKKKMKTNKDQIELFENLEQFLEDYTVDTKAIAYNKKAGYPIEDALFDKMANDYKSYLRETNKDLSEKAAKLLDPDVETDKLAGIFNGFCSKIKEKAEKLLTKRKYVVQWTTEYGYTDCNIVKSGVLRKVCHTLAEAKELMRQDSEDYITQDMMPDFINYDGLDEEEIQDEERWFLEHLVIKQNNDREKIIAYNNGGDTGKITYEIWTVEEKEA